MRNSGGHGSKLQGSASITEERNQSYSKMSRTSAVAIYRDSMQTASLHESRAGKNMNNLSSPESAANLLMHSQDEIISKPVINSIVKNNQVIIKQNDKKNHTQKNMRQ